MCNLYHVSAKQDFERFLRHMGANGWKVPDYGMRTVGPNQDGVFFRRDGDSVAGHVGQWGLIRPGQPERIDYLPSKVPGKKGRPRSTNNARVESIATRPTFKAAWALSQRCLIPAAWYQEPNWETGKNIWWQLKRADGWPWMIAGLWSEWTDPTSGEIVPSFTAITCNCDDHPLLKRLHKPDPELPADRQDKRSLASIAPQDWQVWLYGSIEEARALIQPPPLDAFDLADALRTDQSLAAKGP